MARNNKRMGQGCGITALGGCIGNLILLALVAIVIIFGLPGIIAVAVIVGVIVFFIVVAVQFVGMLTSTKY